MRAAFHEGERALQDRAGVGERMAEIGPHVMRDHMPQQHRDFFSLLPFVVAGTLDARGQPWASVLVGEPGFIESPDPRSLTVRARPLAHDPLETTLTPGASIGLLGIEPHTRRRNRVNGHVAWRRGDEWAVKVDQSFGNCPKYIQARQPVFTGSVEGADTDPAATAAPVQRMEVLDDSAQALIRLADTFFIATAHPQAVDSTLPTFGVDVSHRGGKPGFVRVDDAVLTVPDFSGNFFVNTLGNLLVNPRCGLLFIDFEGGDLLYVAARGEIIDEGPELRAFEGAQRLVRLQVNAAMRVERALQLRWSEARLSPVLAATGAWN